MNTAPAHHNGLRAPASAQDEVRDFPAERIALLAAHQMPDEVTIASVELMRSHGLLGTFGAAYYREVCTGMSTGEASMWYADYQATHAQRIKHRQQLINLLAIGRNKLTHWVDEIPAQQPFRDRQHAEQIVFQDQHGTTVAVRIAQNLEECWPFTITPGITSHKLRQIHPLTDDSENQCTPQQVSDRVRAIMAEASKNHQ